MLRELVILILGAVLIDNFVLVKFLGICPFLGVSRRISTALGMGAAVIFVMAISSAVTWMVRNFLLVPLRIEYLQTISFILVIAALVQFVEIILKKFSNSLYKALGVYLPLITTNCAVLGAAIINIQRNYDLLRSVVYGAGAAAGFTLAIVLFAGVRERIESSPVPECLKGFPISLISAALVSIAFLGFQGLL